MCTHTQKGYFLFSIELLVERFGQQSRKLRWFFAWPCQYTPGYNINTRGISAPLLSSQTQEVQCLSTSGEIALCIPIPHLVVPAHPGMWNDSELSQFSIFKAMYTHGSLRGRSDMKKKSSFALKIENWEWIESKHQRESRETEKTLHPFRPYAKDQKQSPQCLIAHPQFRV